VTELFEKKDNEFIAWYPASLSVAEAKDVWEPVRAAYYVHIPFCDAICDYCGFAVQKKKEANVGAYLDALHREIARYGESGRLTRFRFTCGHFGGGTPSAISGEELVAIKRAIESNFEVAPESEVTVEVNPISFTHDKGEAYAEGGVNRISFGLQSFSDRTLRTIGRPHRARDVTRTLEVIRDVGFENYSLDLIYGVPGQTLDELRTDLLEAVETGATHVSCFRLEIIPFTALKLREAAGELPRRLSVAELNEMDDLVTAVLTANGYREYGAFNFAKPGYESIHNEIAFVAPQGEYVGFGNSAYSYADGFIYANEALVSQYVEEVTAGRRPIAFARRVTAHEEMSRYFVLGLKFFRVSRSGFSARFGLEPEEIFGPVLERLVDGGMLVRDGDDYVLTREGRHFVNNVSKEFYVGPSRGKRQHVQFVPTLTPKQIEFYARKAGLDVEPVGAK
jgi:oxygen-independent coproporphyrinogen III oxidase